MTTSDRAGNEPDAIASVVETRDAAVEAFIEAFGDVLGGNLRRAAETFVATLSTLAATPTQTGAEGPADEVRETLTVSLRVHENDHRELNSHRRARSIEEDDGCRACRLERALLDRLRSGAEVAAAPGLSEAWAAVEAVLPLTGWPSKDGRWVLPRGSWIIGIEYRPEGGDGYSEPHYDAAYFARAQVRASGADDQWFTGDDAETPAAALLALAARLTAKP